MSQLICSSLERFWGEVKISFLILNNFLHKNFLLLTELLFDFPLIVVNWSWAANIRIMCLINHLIMCFFFYFLHYSGRVAGGNLIISFRRWIKIYSLSLIFKILSGRIVKHNCKNCKKKLFMYWMFPESISPIYFIILLPFYCRAWQHGKVVEIEQKQDYSHIPST